MIIEIKHYMEIFWPAHPDKKISFIKKGKTSINHVVEKDPLLFDNKANRTIIMGFRFFDRTEAILEDGEILTGEPKNYSPIYYFGKRINLEELNPFWQKIMKENKANSLIKCECGCFTLPPEIENLTIEEYKNNLFTKNVSKLEKKL